MAGRSGTAARPTRASATQQFAAVLHKNLLLRLRGGRTWLGLGGWVAAAAEVLVPVLFFLVMCIPKHYMRPMPSPRQLAPLYPADMAGWGEVYQGPASARPDSAARVLYAPNTTEVQRLMLLVAKGAACPPDAARPRRNSSTSFFRFWAAPAAEAAATHPECWGLAAGCRAQPACYLPLLGRELVGFASGEKAEAAAAAQPGTVDAVLDLSAWQAALDAPRPARQQQQQQQQQGGGLAAPSASFTYTLRLNHSEVPPTRMRLNQFDLLPGNQWKQYWFFANLQTLVEQAMLAYAAAGTQQAPTAQQAVEGPAGAVAEPAGHPGWAAAAAAESPPLLPLALSVKGFPWPALTLDLGATAAALFFNMLLVFAFLQPTRAAVAAVVQEKELLLREGMRILGLQDAAYWASWFLTHWAGMATSGLLCAVIGLYPFAHSSFLLMLAFYWLVAATLLLFAYCLSTLFSKARVAGGAAAVLYALAMMPGYLMPSLQPYGGPGWALSCLLPPSAISLFASVLVKHEATQQGLTWATIGMPVTVEHSFSAADVYGMLLLDAGLYTLLLWYLDKVMPSDVGQRLPWTFPLSPSYWRQAWRHMAAGVAAASERRSRSSAALSGGPSSGSLSCREAPPAVRIEGLRKVFHTTDGMQKVAVDGLSLDIPRGQITALLGHNGAGKTTTISILSGLLRPTAGDAVFRTGGGEELSVLRDMPVIRGTLGVCPQFDVLWPQLSVQEHLQLWAAIKGYPRGERATLAAAAAAEVGLEEKLGAAAGALSGGQRRKLSVALAFVGEPSVVILDEPTSGMDPHTRRLTWGAIQRRRAAAGTAVLLTTHSMEEADLLADTIAIMAHGRLAALGTSLQLKARFGVGYTLTLSRQPAGSQDGDSAAHNAPHSAAAEGEAGSAAAGERADTAGGTLDGGAANEAGSRGEAGAGAAALTAVVQQHVPGAQLLSATAGEVAYRLPKGAAPAFPVLLRQLQQAGPRLGVGAYGLSETTLEEVFLRVSGSASAAGSTAADGSEAGAAGIAGKAARAPVGDRSELVVVNMPRSSYYRGWALWQRQLRALLAKRALCAARDAWAALVQIAVPVLLVLLALWGGRASAAFPQQPPLPLDRPTALSGNPSAFGAAADVRSVGSGRLAGFLAGYPGAQDSGTSRILTLPFLEPLAGTLDGWLLEQWYSSSSRHYDAFFVQSLPSNLTRPSVWDALGGGSGGDTSSGSGAAVVQRLGVPLEGWRQASAHAGQPRQPWQPAVAQAGPELQLQGSVQAGLELQYSVMVNQTAIHGLPAAISQMHSALLRWITGDPSAGIAATSHPLPVLPHEQDMRITEAAGELLLVMCLVLAASVLSASFAVFLVRERASGSKAVQRVAGVQASAFWAANLLFDLALFSLPAALMVALFSGFHLPAYSGQRLAAVAALLWGFAPAGLCLTYLLQMAFEDEVRVLVRGNSLFFTSGYLGHLAVWILDTIHSFLPAAPGVERARRLLRLALQSISPHFCLGRGVHLVGQTYQPDRLAAHLGAVLSAAGLGGSAGNGNSSASSNSGSGGGFGPEAGSRSPWAWDVSGELLACLAGQALFYGAVVLLIETGVLPRLWRRARAAWRAQGSRQGAGYQRLPGTEQEAAAAGAGAGAAHTAEDGQAEDVDVAAERRAVQSGRLPAASVAVLLQGVSKTYWQPAGRSARRRQGPAGEPAAGSGAGGGRGGPVLAVRDLWLGIGRHEPRLAWEQRGSAGASSGGGGAGGEGECFGLLGVNGAGKTTTWRMVTGEVTPDSGDALVCGCSLLQRPSAARQLLGYCPQASALPAQMTGREVMRLYARLRGLPERLVDPEAACLLKQLGLVEYADRACGSYSGGNRRKLSVAVALVGGAPVILLDEPSTGMDPGARRALWGVIRGEMAAGRDVLLTSHSMEECEAVCSRVGIMEAGRLRALGTVQHLKQQHGQGYSLDVRVAPGCAAAAEQLVAACCPAARRRAAHWRAGAEGQLEGGGAGGAGAAGAAGSATGAAGSGGGPGGDEEEEAHQLCFAIPQQGADLPALFEALERGRTADGVLEYSLSQTTLEQVFLEVASEARQHAAR